MADRLYYPHDYTDEVVPCDCTLEGWAAWFAAPDPAWNRPEPARPGDTFPATVAKVEELECHRTHDGWAWDRANEARLASPHTTFYLRHGPGEGWTPDNSGVTVREVLEGFVGDAEPGERVFLAALNWVGHAELRFEIGEDGPYMVVTPVGRA